MFGLLIGGAGCGSDDSDSAGGETRRVAHAMGTTEVPKSPERVVVLDTGELDAVTALGVMPVGAVEAESGAGILDYLDAGSIELVGTIETPNLEKITALQPDLILSNKVRHEELYDELSAIAPTVFAEKVGVVWKENFMLDALALGKEDQARELMADYQKRTAELGASVGNPADTVVSVVRFIPGQIRLYAEGSFIGTILSDIGFSRPPAQQTDETFVEASQEQAGLADGDVIFVTTYGPAEKTDLATVSAGPLWQTLGAVQAGRVEMMPDDHWMTGIGIGAAQKVLDDLQRYFA